MPMNDDDFMSVFTGRAKVVKQDYPVIPTMGTDTTYIDAQKEKQKEIARSSAIDFSFLDDDSLGLGEKLQKFWRVQTNTQTPDERLASAEKVGNALGLVPQTLAENDDLYKNAVLTYESQRNNAYLQGKPFTPQTVAELYPELDTEDTVATTLALRDFNNVLKTREAISQGVPVYALGTDDSLWGTYKAGAIEGANLPGYLFGKIADFASKAYDAGQALDKQSELMYRASTGELSDEEVEKELPGLMTANKELDTAIGDSYVAKIVGETISQLSMQKNMMLRGAEKILAPLMGMTTPVLQAAKNALPQAAAMGTASLLGAAGATGTVAGGTIAGAAALAGALTLGTAAVFVGTYRAEAGQAYWDWRTKKGKNGQRTYTREQAIGHAKRVGIMNAAIEAGAWEVAFKGIAKVYGREAATAVIKDTEAMKKMIGAGRKAIKLQSLKYGAKQFAKVAIPETIEEGLQSLTADIDTNLFGEGGISKKEMFNNALDAMIQAVPSVIGMSAGGSLLGGMGAYRAMKKISGLSEMKEAATEFKRTNETTMLQKMMNLRNESSLFKKAPEAYRKTIQNQMDQSGMGTVYIDVQAAAENESTHEALNEMVEKGIVSAKELDESIQSGKPLEIESGKYMQLASEESPQILADYTTMDKGERTLHAIKEERQRYKDMIDIVTSTKEKREAAASEKILKDHFSEDTEKGREDRATAQELLSGGLDHLQENYKTLLEEAKKAWGDLSGVKDLQDYMERRKTQDANTSGEKGVDFIDIGEGPDRVHIRESKNPDWYQDFYGDHDRAPTQRELYDVAHQKTIKEVFYKNDEDSHMGTQELEAAKAKVESLERVGEVIKTLDKKDLVAQTLLDSDTYEEAYKPLLAELSKGNPKVAQAARDSALVLAKLAENFHKNYGIPLKLAVMKVIQENEKSKTETYNQQKLDPKEQEWMNKRHAELKENQSKEARANELEKFKQSTPLEIKQGEADKQAKGLKAGTAIPKIFKEKYPNGAEIDTPIGKIKITARGIKNSLSHGMSKEKLDATLTLADGLKQASYIGSLDDMNGKAIINHYFAYKANYQSEERIVLCRVRETHASNSFYVHEVYLLKDTKKEEQSVSRDLAESRRSWGPVLLYTFILQQFLRGGNIKEILKNETTGYHQMAGENAKNAPAGLLDEARKMEEEDVDVYTIWEKTGWFRGPERVWRFEIPDNLNGIDIDYLQVVSLVPLGNVYKNPMLYEAYPELKDIPVKVKKLEKNTYGSCDPDGSIVLNEELVNSNPNEAKLTLLHELQHVIQRKFEPDFSRGGNAKTAKMQIQRSLEVLHQKLSEEEGTTPEVDDYIEKLTKYIHSEEGADWWSLMEAAEEAGEKLSVKKRETIRWLMNSIQNAEQALRQNDYTAYRRLGGEAEAYMVQDRAQDASKRKDLPDYYVSKVGYAVVNFGRVELPFLQQQPESELAEIKAKYKNNEQWMKAPDGSRTKLTERQWLISHSDSFKKWFGDWETVEKYNDLLYSPALLLNQQNLESIKSVDPKMAREKAKATFKKLFAPVKNASGYPEPAEVQRTDGNKVLVPNSAFKEIRRHSADKRVLAVIPQLQEIIREARFLFEQEKDLSRTKRLNQTTIGYKYYGAKISTEGKTSFIRLVTRLDENGKQYLYDVDFNDYEKNKKSLHQTMLPDPKNGSQSDKAFFIHSIQEWLENVKGITDKIGENGDILPEVINNFDQSNRYYQTAYHGTPYEFSKFDLGAIGSGEGAQIHGWGLYFTANRKIAETRYRDRLLAILTRRGKIPNYAIYNNKKRIAYTSNKGLYENIRDPSIISATLGGDMKPLRQKLKELRATRESFENSFSAKRARKQIAAWEEISNTVSSTPKVSMKKLIEIAGEKDEGYTMKAFIELAKKDAKAAGHRTTTQDVRPYIENRVKILKENYESDLREVSEITDAVNGIDIGNATLETDNPKGTLFEVDVPENEVLLDEDKPLKEQPPKIKEAISSILTKEEYTKYREGNAAPNIEDATGAQLYKAIAEKIENESSSTIYKPDKEAALLLNRAGIKGITYDGDIDGRCFVVFDDQAISIIEKYNQEMNGSQYQGAYNPNSNVIEIFDGANKSTAIHEGAHMFLTSLENLSQMSEEELIKAFNGDTKSAKQSQDKVRKDLMTIRNWAVFSEEHLAEYKGTSLEKEFNAHADAIRRGDANAEEIWIQERFARGFEKYLMDGSAPTREMRGVFRRFKSWLTDIYKTAKNLGNVNLTPEIKDVFDKMLATENEINAWAAQRKLESIDKAINVDKSELDNLKEWAENVKQKALEKAMSYYLHMVKEDAIEQFRASISSDEARADFMKSLGEENEIYKIEQIYNSPTFPTKKDREAFLKANNISSEAELREKLKDAGGTSEERWQKNISDMVQSYKDEALTPEAVQAMAEEILNSPEGMERKSRIEAMLLEKKVTQYINLVTSMQLELKRSKNKLQTAREIRKRLGLATEKETAELEKQSATIAKSEEKITKLEKQVKDLREKLKIAKETAETQKEENKSRKESAENLEGNLRAIEQELEKERNAHAKLQETNDDTNLTVAELSAKLKAIKEGWQSSRKAMRLDMQQIKEDARNTLGEEKLSHAISWRWWQNQASIAEGKAMKAASKNDWDQAAYWKQAQAQDLIMAKQARANEDEIRHTLHGGGGKLTTAMLNENGMEKYGILGILNRIGRNDKPVMMQDDARYFVQHMAYVLGITKTDGRLPIDKNGMERAFSWKWLALEMNPMQAMANSKYEGGDIIPPWMKGLFDKGEPIKLQTLTMNQFREMAKVMKAVYKLGRREYEGNTLGTSFEKASAEIAEEIRKGWDHRRTDPLIKKQTATSKDRRGTKFHKLLRSITLPEILIERMGKKATKYIYDPIDKATAQRRELKAEAKEAMQKIFKMYTASEWAKMRNQKLYTYGIDDKGNKLQWTKEEVICMALNFGTQSNRDRVIETLWGTENQLLKFLDETLTDRDWDFVEAIWNHENSYWGARNKVQNDLYGMPLGKVPGLNFVVGKGRIIHGQYYRIKYDPEISNNASKHSKDDMARMDMENMSTFSLGMGSTKKRALTSGGQKLRFDLDVYTESIQEAIQHISMREAAVDVYKLLHQEDVVAAIETTMGVDTLGELQNWVKDNWHSSIKDMCEWDSFFGRCRRRFTFATMGFRFSTALLNVGNILGMMDRIGAYNTIKAMGDFYFSGGITEKWNFITMKSSMMKERAATMDRDAFIGDSLPVQKYESKWRSKIEHGKYGTDSINAKAYSFIAFTDMLCSCPEWLFTYRRALVALEQEGNLTREEMDQEAVRQADKTVRETFGSGEMKDQTEFMRKNGPLAQATAFFSYTNLVTNQFIRAGYLKYDTGNIKPLLKATWYWWILGALLETTLRAWGDDSDDDDKWKKKFAHVMASGGPLGGVPVARDTIPWAVDYLATGKAFGDATPDVSSMDAIKYAGKAFQSLSKGEFIETGRASSKILTRTTIPLPDTITDAFWNFIYLISTDNNYTMTDFLWKSLWDRPLKDEKKGKKKKEEK